VEIQKFMKNGSNSGGFDQRRETNFT